MSKWNAADVPDQRGRTAVVTGANAGIGFETAAVLAARGAHVVLAVRDVDKGKDAAARIVGRSPHAEVSVIRLDLASLDSVRAAADEINGAYQRIDLLINNAGVMLTPKAATVDGFELQFGTNHLGHFALTGLLLASLLVTAGSRVVTVSSLAHRVKADPDDLQSERDYDRMTAYGTSKLANLLFTYELQRRMAKNPNIDTIAVAAHPGSSRTDLFRNSPGWIKVSAAIANRLIAQPAAMGALPTLRAACDPKVLGGQYYGPGGFCQQRGYPVLVRSSDRSYDVSLARQLWAESEELTGVGYCI